MDNPENQANSLNYYLAVYRDNTLQTVFVPEFPLFKITIGVRVAAEKYSLQWLLFTIFVAQELALLYVTALQIWHIHRVSDDKVMIIACDAFGKVIYVDKIEDKSFLHDYFKIFWVDRLLLLPSETKRGKLVSIFNQVSQA